MTSKRQVTFPKKVCESLGIQAGDEILLDRHEEGGREVWYLRTDHRETRPWLGSLREFALNKPHSMDSVRKSVALNRDPEKE